MEWLAFFLAVALVVAAVSWMAARALARRRGRGRDASTPEEQAGPRHYDVSSVGRDDPGDAGS